VRENVRILRGKGGGTLTYGEKRAVNEVLSILESQWRNGMLPHIRFVGGRGGYSPDAGEWGVPREVSGNACLATSGITQPPLLGYSLGKMVEKARNVEAMLREVDRVYARVNEYHAFLLRERDPDGEGLVSVVHPWETGTDDSPCLDEPISRTRAFLEERGVEQRIKKRKDTNTVSREYRPTASHYDCFGRLIGFFREMKYDQTRILRESPFVVQDVLFNAIFAASAKSLSVLAGELSGRHRGTPKEAYYREEKERNATMHERIRAAIRTKLYDEKSGLFYSFDVAAGKHLRVDTIHSVSPLFGECATEEQAGKIQERLRCEEEFLTETVIPTVSRKMPQFDPLRYWRGPVWPVTNWLVHEGLKKYDGKKAEALRQSTIRTIEQNRKTSGERFLSLAASLMMYNSYRDRFTTPSRAQYQHGWLWDSCLAAVGWVHVPEEPAGRKFWDAVARRYVSLQEKAGPGNAQRDIAEERDCVLFSEYFVPIAARGYPAGAPIGAPLMTWTASLYLDLKHTGSGSDPRLRV
jgi:hypothetical protein